jgi:transcriptional regulator with XRE-family HTH domain
MEYDTNRESEADLNSVNSAGLPVAPASGDSRIESAVFENDVKRPISTTKSKRLKSSLRLRYEAEVSVIKKKLGDLDEMRNLLGISQRKICQLLFVDPSAWTRWTKSGEEAPPHIYRMLTWYLALNDKYPALDVNFWLQTVTRANEGDSVQELQRKIAVLSSELAQYRSDSETRTTLLEAESRKNRQQRTIIFAALIAVTIIALIIVSVTHFATG